MAAAPYDPTKEFPPMQVIVAGAILTLLAFGVVYFIIASSEAEQAAPVAAGQE